MNALTLTIHPISKRREKVRVELDAERFERLAAGLGLFNSEFVASIDRAEREIAEKRTKCLKSLRDLRRA